jgi:hypothetical protein
VWLQIFKVGEKNLNIKESSRDNAEGNHVDETEPRNCPNASFTNILRAALLYKR